MSLSIMANTDIGVIWLKFEITIPQVDPHLLYFRQLLSTIYIAKYGDWMKPFMEAGSDSMSYLMVKIFRFASWGCELGNYLKMGWNLE